MTERARTIFLGSGSFAVPVVEALLGHPAVDLAAVVTAPTRAGSRGQPTDPPVADWATQHGIPMLQPTRLREADSVAELASLAPELLVLSDYGQIVPVEILDLPVHGALNIHPSLLPLYRGASPIRAAILAGDAETGVTLMLMEPALDSGPIIAQSHHALDGTETAPQLEAELARDGSELLASNLSAWLNGDIWPRPQEHDSATMTRPLRRSDGVLDTSRTGAELERQIRAYQPWPGSFVETNAGRLIVWQAHIAHDRTHMALGELRAWPDGRLSLSASDKVLDLDEVQLAGGRRMSGAELIRGRPTIRALNSSPAETPPSA